MPLDDCRILSLPKIQDARGNLTFIENTHEIPFEMKRVYYLYDVPGGADRGAHAHKALHQLVIAVSGSFEIELDDGQNKRRFRLDRPYSGLYICPMMWRQLDNFSSGAVCLVLASELYDETDYLRDYQVFLKAAEGTK
jgi:dTDP-4-dehydrorhamnose 3,5-epimerase-like enzyme